MSFVVVVLSTEGAHTTLLTQLGALHLSLLPFLINRELTQLDVFHCDRLVERELTQRGVFRCDRLVNRELTHLGVFRRDGLINRGSTY